MVSLKKKFNSLRLLASFTAIMFAFSMYGFGISKVFAEVSTGKIQVNGMSSFDKDTNYMYYYDPQDSTKLMGKVFCTSLPRTLMTLSDGQNTCKYAGLAKGDHVFEYSVSEGFKLSVNIDGSDILGGEKTGEGSFNITVADSSPIIINPSFSPVSIPNPPPPPSQSADMKIWVGDTLAIDSSASTPKTSYSGNDFTINKGMYHADYELEFTKANVTMGAVRIEGEGILAIIPYYNSGQPGTVYESSIGKNAPTGCSIYSELKGSQISVETMEGTGNGALNLAGGVNISGSFGALDRTINIGTSDAPSPRGICASNVVVDYGTLNMYCDSILFNGISQNSKMDIDVLNVSKLYAETANSDMDALENVNNVTVMCGGSATIKQPFGNFGPFKKQARYYDFVNFGTEQVVEERKDIKTIDASNPQPGDDKYYSMTSGEDSFILTSLSKPMRTLSFNMTDGQGNIIEDTKVANGTVKVKTACGIGRGADGRTFNDFKIEEGTPVTISFLPDYGYQFTSGSINGAAVTIAQEDVATYEFTMPANHLHLSAIFTSSNDSVVITNNDISSALVSGLEGQINGNAELNVAPAENVDEAAFRNASDGMNIASFENISLNQVINKGSLTEAWKSPVTDLSAPSKVSLEVSDDIAGALASSETVGMLREHNGEISLLEASYNPDTKSILFETDDYSTYAIAYNTADKTSESSKSAGFLSTGDASCRAELSILAFGAFMGILKTRKRKNV